MNLRIPERNATFGGVLISVSGVVNALLGMQIGAKFYDAYPGGKMGHVGIIAGVAAIAIGLAIVFFVVPIYRRTNRIVIALGGILTIVLGHVGAVAGAIYIGTVGMLLCYIAGIWLLVAAAIGVKGRES